VREKYCWLVADKPSEQAGRRATPYKPAVAPSSTSDYAQAQPGRAQFVRRNVRNGRSRALRLLAPRSCKRTGTGKKLVNASHRTRATTPVQLRSLQKSGTDSAPPRHVSSPHKKPLPSRHPCEEGEDE
jgi:hypothetical protein